MTSPFKAVMPERKYSRRGGGKGQGHGDADERELRIIGTVHTSRYILAGTRAAFPIIFTTIVVHLRNTFVGYRNEVKLWGVRPSAVEPCTNRPCTYRAPWITPFVWGTKSRRKTFPFHYYCIFALRPIRANIRQSEQLGKLLGGCASQQCEVCTRHIPGG